MYSNTKLEQSDSNYSLLGCAVQGANKMGYKLLSKLTIATYCLRLYIKKIIFTIVQRKMAISNLIC